MARKNFKVATAENGETTIVKIDKTPTGKVKTLKDKETLRKEREEQYKNFRINALKRRAKRMGLTEEQTKVKVDELLKQMASSTEYNILIMFNRENADLVKQALLNDTIQYKILTDTYGYIEGDADLLKDLRELLPPGTKIHPYTKKKPPILPTSEPKKRGIKKYTKAQKKKMAAEAKKARKTNAHMKYRKRVNVAALSKKEQAKFKARVKALKASWKASKKTSGTTISQVNKKPSKSLKTASKTIKKAA